MINLRRAVILMAMAACASFTVGAAPSDNLTITANELAYDGKTDVATAEGNVVLTKEDKTMTGASGWYNLKSEEAYLTGGVNMTGTNMSMSAGTVHAYQNNDLLATGNVHLQKDDRQVFGDTVRYNTQTEYGRSDGNAKLIVADFTMTANNIEAWLGRIEAHGYGNVKIHSTERNLDGSGDQVDYTQTPNQNDGVGYLRGNAHAVQNGNTLDGETIKFEQKDNSIQTMDGRATLVIVPK